ncbi:MAG: two-component system response regulator [Acidobacteria bacterium]|nr:two-component system response regulator [Acidobacteriota bacterium]
MTKTAVRDVLIVDDDESVRTMLNGALTRAGLACDTAADGLYALEHLSTSRYVVVLLDLAMPRLDGAGVLREIRSLGLPDADRPIVLMVTSSTDRESLHAVGDMAQMVIKKPFDLGHLRELVEDCVSARRT